MNCGQLPPNTLKLFEDEVKKANAAKGDRGHFVDFRPLKYLNYAKAVKGLQTKFAKYCNDNDAKTEALKLAKRVVAGRAADMRRIQERGQHADAGHKYVKKIWDSIVRDLTKTLKPI